MKKVNPSIFKRKTTIEFLPTETLLGLKMVNCDVLCEDDTYRPVLGVELGFIFFTISFINMTQ
jgi:hypothetical protein|tara:strand:+ start:1718 stop:1906 length:189 start_codon:yes stop_codon:yes gene_type:complete